MVRSARLKVPQLKPPRFTSRARSPRLTAHLGLLLGVSFGICFATGLLSHFIQHPPAWFHWPARPVQLYRITQGVHVATGLACFPLLTLKVWSVFPKLFAWPPVRNVPHALERLSIGVLSGAAVFELVTGLLNIAYWYSAMPFGFIGAHYWTAWLAIGAILVHVAVKLPIVRRALTRDPEPAPRGPGLTRRKTLALAGTAVGVVTLATVGQTVRPLRGVSLLSPRVPGVGPQRLPVNKTARAAQVQRVDDRYTLRVLGLGTQRRLTLGELRALPQYTVELPISCVEGWSASAHWTGVRVADLLELVGLTGAVGPVGSARLGHRVAVESLQPSGGYRVSTLEAAAARDPLTLLALRVNGEELDLDHGYPCRLIAPNRPGALQTKWVGTVRVLA
jgi:DMSO/TMAO reductase YedYZ molybdopterin-dependent catalytic subunit